jgi:WG containing repeat
MKKTINQTLFMLHVGLLIMGVACTQSTDNNKKESKTTASDLLTMTQTDDGKWVIMDSQKTTLYEVFIYDNGPDYPSEDLIRVLKNGKIGYADAKTYTIVIPPQFDCAFPFENGKAKVSNQCKTVKDGEHSIWESETWQYVDKMGKF